MGLGVQGRTGDKQASNKASPDNLIGPDGPPKRRRIFGKCKGFRCLGSACNEYGAPAGPLNSDVANLQDLDEVLDARAPVPSSRKVGFAKNETGKWTCPICQTSVLMGSKGHHIRTRHPDVPFDLFTVEAPTTVAVSWDASPATRLGMPVVLWITS